MSFSGSPALQRAYLSSSADRMRDRECKEDKDEAEPGATDNPDDAQRLREDH